MTPPPRRCPCGKKRYHSSEAATLACARMLAVGRVGHKPGKVLRAYRCPADPTIWHVGNSRVGA